MRRIICLTALILVFLMLSGCGVFKSFDENNIVCQIKVYDNWEEKTCCYEVDNKGNERECGKFEPNAKKVYYAETHYGKDYEESPIMMEFAPNLDKQKTFKIEHDKKSGKLSKPLIDTLKIAGEKFAYCEGYHDTWLTKLFEYDGGYYLEAMLNVNISCPYYLLKLDEENQELVKMWCGSDKEILKLRIIKNGQGFES